MLLSGPVVDRTQAMRQNHRGSLLCMRVSGEMLNEEGIFHESREGSRELKRMLLLVGTLLDQMAAAPSPAYFLRGRTRSRSDKTIDQPAFVCYNRFAKCLQLSPIASVG
jgi:hypothetical protein